MELNINTAPLHCTIIVLNSSILVRRAGTSAHVQPSSSQIRSPPARLVHQIQTSWFAGSTGEGPLLCVSGSCTHKACGLWS